jgi:hypothetical protein
MRQAMGWPTPDRGEWPIEREFNMPVIPPEALELLRDYEIQLKLDNKLPNEC